MSPNHPQGSSKEQLWRAVVRRWRASGLSVRAFCQQQGIAQPTFYAWRRTLAQRDAETVNFVPVRVTADSQALTTADSWAGAVELVLGAGRRLRVGPGFDGPTLTRLLALLEEGRS